MNPGSAAYNLCRAWRLTGGPNFTALEWSIDRILRRHEVLRSAIHLADGRPVQIVQPPAEFKLAVVDLRKTLEVDREAKVRRRILETAEIPFDFAAGTFLRAELLQVARDEHILVLATHHIVSDAWSMGILSRELWSLYKTYTAGAASDLEELPIQYADFAVWQREWLQGDVLDSQLSYWKKQLSDLPIVNLPTDRPRAPKQTSRGARVSIALPESLSAAINELSNECGVTPFMTLLAAFQVLLYRYTGEENIVVGSPMANRVRPELERLVGFFVNTLVFRSDISGNPTFKEFLYRVREVCLAAQEHQDLPFEKLVQELNPERDQSRNPLFQVMFVLQNATRGISPVKGLRIEPVEFETGRSLFDLSLYLRERDRKFMGYFEYSTDLFDAPTIQRMRGHLQILLKAIVTDRDQRISTLPLLTDAERHQLLVEWNDTAAEYPKDKCIHELFEEQVSRTPERIAITFKGQSLTYRQLNSRSNRLAHYLRDLGVGPESLVGICVERSLEMVVGLLGILKAGGAYVPLDPTYPKERLRFVLKDAQVAVLLTHENLAEDKGLIVEDGHPRWSVHNSQSNVVYLDRDWPLIAQQQEKNLRGRAISENLVYVIYTSGSTGHPKGVAVEHRSLTNCVHSLSKIIGLSPRDKWLSVTNIAFDIAGLELFLPLLTGAKVILTSPNESTDARLLLRRLQSMGATVMQGTPATWKMLIDAGWHGKKTLKAICGGESLTPELAEQLLSRSAVVWNCYGPTETTIWSTVAQIQVGEKAVSLGRPLANTQVYVLDSQLQPVPIGVYGELYIGGVGVARGYPANPKLTAEKFIRNHFSKQPGAHLYRTGDQVRYCCDGSLRFLGRKDGQVKIRGHRIEIGEIEVTLNQHPEVKDSAVVVREWQRSEHELVAYFVPEHPSVSPVIELRSFMREKLPEYMIPGLFISLDVLPVTQNGKVDRTALRSLHECPSNLIAESPAARNEVEELITNVWCDVLKIDPPGIHENFFNLGGHSLLAVRVVARIEEAFQKQITLRDFFDTPTISAVGHLIATTTLRKKTRQLPPILSVTRDTTFPLSAVQKQLWALEELFPGALFSIMPYVYRLTGRINVEALTSSLQAIVNRHEAFRMIFGRSKGRPVQIVGPIPQIDLRIVDLQKMISEEAEKEYERISAEDAESPFDLEQGPPVRFSLIHFNETEHLLLVTVHHIVCDHWSMVVFRRELISLYDAIANRKPPTLFKIRVQLVDYVCWEKRLMKARLFKRQVEYWKKIFEPNAPLLKFKVSRTGVRSLGFGTDTQAIPTGETLLTDIRASGGRNDCTTFMVLVAIIAAILFMHTDQSTIRIATTVANRRRPETESLIANCLNAVVLQLNLSWEMTFRELLQQARYRTLEALSHQDVPLGLLARTLTQQKSTRNAEPLYQVMLIYQNRSFRPVEVAGLRFASWEGKYRRAKESVSLTPLDLIFEFRELSTSLIGSVTYRTSTVDAVVVSKFISWFGERVGVLLRRAAQPLKSIID